MTHKNRKKSRIVMFLSTGCFIFRAEGFSCSLDILRVGLEIKNAIFLYKKYMIFFQLYKFTIFSHQNPGCMKVNRKTFLSYT